MTPAVAKGITLTFTGFTAQLLDVGLPDIKGGTVKTTHQGTTADSGVIWDTFLASGFVDPGSIKCKIQYDISAVPPVGTSGALVIDYGTNTWTMSNAIFTECSGNAPMGQLIEGDATWKLSGKPSVGA